MDIISFNEASTANGRIESFIENPDSTSGIVTVPKTIASGETITIPAGRIAVLPNVQVDGTLNIEGEVFVPSGATFSDLESQIALKADTSYVNSQLSLKANLASFIGTNQGLTVNGYQKLPGGLIIQWGSVDYGVASAAFPISFPNAFFGISAVSFQGEGVPRYTGFTLSGFITASAGAATASKYIAIGY